MRDVAEGHRQPWQCAQELAVALSSGPKRARRQPHPRGGSVLDAVRLRRRVLGAPDGAYVLEDRAATRSFSRQGGARIRFAPTGVTAMPSFDGRPRRPVMMIWQSAEVLASVGCSATKRLFDFSRQASAAPSGGNVEGTKPLGAGPALAFVDPGAALSATACGRALWLQRAEKTP